MRAWIGHRQIVQRGAAQLLSRACLMHLTSQSFEARHTYRSHPTLIRRKWVQCENCEATEILHPTISHRGSKVHSEFEPVEPTGANADAERGRELQSPVLDTTCWRICMRLDVRGAPVGLCLIGHLTWIVSAVPYSSARPELHKHRHNQALSSLVEAARSACAPERPSAQ